METCCCPSFRDGVRSGDIVNTQNTKGERGVWIYGRPDFANDGDGHVDNMTDTYRISFCPFCGTVLSKKPSKEL